MQESAETQSLGWHQCEDENIFTLTPRRSLDLRRLCLYPRMICSVRSTQKEDEQSCIIPKRQVVSLQNACPYIRRLWTSVGIF